MGRRDGAGVGMVGMSSTGYGAVAASEPDDNVRTSYGGAPPRIDTAINTGGDFGGYGGGTSSTGNSYGGSLGAGLTSQPRLYKYVQSLVPVGIFFLSLTNR